MSALFRLLLLLWPCFPASAEPLRPGLRDEFEGLLRWNGRDDGCEGTFVEGRTSFFCFDAGRISSRSTGTPRETRKRRRMRERFQSGGWRGGGATSWFQRDSLGGVSMVGNVWGGG